MPRWEPHSEQRLMRAALDAFDEEGYDNTTVAAIADRAGLNRSTLFRHFRDKREVVFAGQDELTRLMIDAISTAPASSSPLEAVQAALDAAATGFLDERREVASRRQRLIAANSQLQERQAFKMTAIAAAMKEAFTERGVPDDQASVAAQLGVLAFTTTFGRWTASETDISFGELSRQVLSEIERAITPLASRTSDGDPDAEGRFGEKPKLEAAGTSEEDRR